MKRAIWPLLAGTILVILPLLQGPTAPDLQGPAHGIGSTCAPLEESADLDALELLSGIRGCFEENRGQVANPEVRFYAQGEPLSVGLTSEGVVFVLRETGEVGPGAMTGRPTSGTTHVFTLTFDGSNRAEPTGRGVQDHPSNFYDGTDPSTWVTGVRSFQEVLYEGLYDGIDLRFHFLRDTLKYEFILEPGADPGDITLTYHGISGLSVDEATGELVITTAGGDLRDARPVVLQDKGAGPEELPGRFDVRDGLSWGFSLPPECDADRPMVIDPGLEFSTFFGGTNGDYAHSVAVDDDGLIYIAGRTSSRDFPTTYGAHKWDSSKMGCCDAFVMKMLLPNKRGFCTYLGGDLHDGANGIRVLSDGSIWVLGETTGNFICPSEGHYSDVFLAWLENNGSWVSALQLSYAFDEYPAAFHVGDDGDFVVAGYTNSPGIHTHEGAFCRTYNGYYVPWSGAFIIKGRYSNVTPGFELVYGTYINGICSDDFYWTPKLDLAVDADDNIILVGSCSESHEFPLLEGSFCSTYSGGSTDGFALKFDPTLSTVLDGAFVGGSLTDAVHAVELTEDGSVLLTGFTNSSDFPTTQDAFCRTSRGGHEAFVMELDGDLSALGFSALIGSEGHDTGAAMSLAPDGGSVSILGIAQGANLTCTPGCFDNVTRGGTDLLVAVVNMTDRRLEYCTCLGGSERDTPSWDGIFYGSDGWLYVCGYTESWDFPTTPDAGRSHFKGTRYNAYVLSINPRACDVPGAPSNLTALAGDGCVTVSWDPVETRGARVLGHNIYRGTSSGEGTLIGSVPWRWVNFTDHDAVNGVNYQYMVRAVNSAGEGPSNSTWARPLGLPGPPRELTPSLLDGDVNLTWVPPEDTGGEVLGYRVLRGVSSEDLDVLVPDVGNVTTFLDSDVIDGVDYYYAVIAFNVKGEGPISRQAHVVPMSPPSPPMGFSVEPGDGRVSLSWSRPQDSGGSPVIGFCVYRGASVDDLALLVERRSSELGFEDVGLENGCSYYYRVTAVNVVSESRSTSTLMATPYGLPGAPKGLVATAGDRSVVLSWDPPQVTGGREIIGYVIYTGSYAGALTFSVIIEDETTYTHPDLTNGQTYWYLVAAVNDAGEGPASGPASAMPMRLPGPLDHFSGHCIPEGVALQWTAPADWGGAERLTYQVLRGDAEDSMVVIAELSDAVGYLDTAVEGGEMYLYSARAVNSRGSGPCAPDVRINVTSVPGPVVDLVALAGDGFVELIWSPPRQDGGATVTSYILYRGYNDIALAELARLKVGTFNDSEVENLHTTFYTVVAVNAVGESVRCAVVNATPMALPGCPVLFTASVQEGAVVLSWGAPYGQGCAPITGYDLFRGTSDDELQLVAHLGLVTDYIDGEVADGGTYHYRLSANSSVGPGPSTQVLKVDVEGAQKEAKVEPGYLLLAALVLVGFAATLYTRTRRASPDEVQGTGLDEDHPSDGTDSKVHASVASPVVVVGPSGYLVEQIFVVYRDGRLILECSRDECRTNDANLMSGMLIAVQGIVQDGLEPGGALESIRYGENLILMAGGRNVTLAVVVYGRPTDELKAELESVVQVIEASYAGVIDEWVGDLSVLGGIRGMVEDLLGRGEDLTREDVGEVTAEQGVSLLSAVDFHRGYVRLKVAALNITDMLISEAAIQVRYDPDMLRLERVEPPTLRLWGDRVTLGTVKPDERKTVALLFDPQICQETFIDGTLTYYNARGVFQHVDMKRRHADVVCPVLFTKEHINTAVLRRLLRDELFVSDQRMFRYPEDLSPEEVLSLGKEVMGGQGVQLVREYVVGGPPYEAEVWYYGETRTGGSRVVMRLSLRDEANLMGFHVASSVMEPITGLLAEFRKELNRFVEERYSGKVRMAPEREDAGGTGQERSLLLIEDDEQNEREESDEE